MAKASNSRKRLKPKDTKRRGKKKVSPLASDAIEYLDYKDVDLLKRFLSDRAKIRPRRVSGNDMQQQRVVARAIKNAREMGLLPYTSRVTTQRRGRSDRGDRPERGDRSDRGDRPDRGEGQDRDGQSSDIEEQLDGTEGVEFVEAADTGSSADEVVTADAGSEI